MIHLTDVAKLPVTNDDEPTSRVEIETARCAASLPADLIPGMVAYEWWDLQQVPSYVDVQIAANRGLLEGIATQS